MSKHKGTHWFCPLCLEGVHPYPTNPCKGIAECGNTPNANAFQYLDKDGYKHYSDTNEVKTIGIGAISNE